MYGSPPDSVGLPDIAKFQIAVCRSSGACPRRTQNDTQHDNLGWQGPCWHDWQDAHAGHGRGKVIDWNRSEMIGMITHMIRQWTEK